MRLEGEWTLCDDGIVRPVIRGQIRAANDVWRAVPFLLDTGADRTVFDADTLKSLGFPQGEVQRTVGGVGGTPDSVEVTTTIRFR